MLIKLFNNIGHDGTKLYLNYCTSVYLTLPQLLCPQSHLSHLSQWEFPHQPPQDWGSTIFHSNGFFQILNQEQSPQKDISFYMNRINICSLEHVKWAIQYLSILIGIAWCPTIFHWLNFFFLNGDSKTIPRPNIFHRGFSSQVKWIKKIDQK